MTVIYDEYYKNIALGLINLANVNYSCLLVGDYAPDSTHSKDNVTGILIEAHSVLVGEDIISLSMAEIVEKVNALVLENKDSIDISKVTGFVFYALNLIYTTDEGTQEITSLCFYEPLTIKENG